MQVYLFLFWQFFFVCFDSMELCQLNILKSHPVTFTATSVNKTSLAAPPYHRGAVLIITSLPRRCGAFRKLADYGELIMCLY